MTTETEALIEHWRQNGAPWKPWRYHTIDGRLEHVPLDIDADALFRAIIAHIEAGALPAQLQDAAIEYLEAYLYHENHLEDELLRQAAKRALRTTERAFEGDAAIRAAATLMLTYLDPESFKVIVAECSDEANDGFITALVALTQVMKCGDRVAIAAAERILRNPQTSEDTREWLTESFQRNGLFSMTAPGLHWVIRKSSKYYSCGSDFTGVTFD